MDIDHLGEAVVEQLVLQNLVTRTSDLYRLTKKQALGLEGFAEKSAENLIRSIHRSKNQELWRLICGLGIKHVGAAAAKDLARTFRSLDKLAGSSVEKLYDRWYWRGHGREHPAIFSRPCKPDSLE